MTDFDFLIVGGGMVADAAARGIRELDKSSTIGILSEDIDPPYARPALSKKLWTDDDFDWNEGVDLHTADETGATILLSTTVTGIDRDAKTVTTADGSAHRYGRLLIATGGHPRALPGADLSERVLAYRSAADYRSLRALADRGAHVIVVGGGYIGTEVASGIVQKGASVTLVTPDEHVGASTYPATLVEHFERRFVDHGVALETGRRVASVEDTGSGVRVTLDDDRVLEADAVVAGLGIEPAVDVAQSAGLSIGDGGGVLVDETLATEDADVLAAGDVAEYPDRILGTRRVEHVDNAQEQGRQAGRNLAGANEPYTHTPMFYSDVFDMGYEAVGQLSSSLDMVEDWKEPGETGVVYYLQDGEVKGVLLWNVWDKTDEARKVINDGSTHSADDLRGRIPFE